jgi:predicted PurR-regulated permease PerM
MLRGVVEALNWVPEEDPENYDPRAVLVARIGTLIEDKSEEAFDIILANAATLVGITGRGAGGVAGVVLGMWNRAMEVVLFLGNVVLFTFVTVYLLRDYKAVIAGIRGLIPERHRDYISEIFRRIDRQLQAFFRGQLIVCVCLAVLYSIGLTLSGTPFALTLGIFGGIVSFVPFLGLILTIGPAVLLTLLQHGLDGHVVGVLATFIFAQALEGNFLTPKIVGSQVGLGPVWVILAVMVFGTTLGFKGLLIAVPLAATCKVLVVEALAYYKRSSFFTASS